MMRRIRQSLSNNNYNKESVNRDNKQKQNQLSTFKLRKPDLGSPKGLSSRNSGRSCFTGAQTVGM